MSESSESSMEMRSHNGGSQEGHLYIQTNETATAIIHYRRVGERRDRRGRARLDRRRWLG